MHVVDGDAFRAEVTGQALGQADQRRFAHGVRAATGEGHAIGVGAADVDDPAALGHVFGRGLGGDEHAAYVDGQGLVEIFEFEIFQRRNGQHASVVDQDIQSTKGLYRRRNCVANGFGVGTVSLDGQGFAAIGDDGVLQFFSLCRGADVGEGNGCAFSGQAFDNGCADAPGTALNQCHFAAEVLSSHIDLQVPRRDVPVDGA
ncbi:hypothetical protein D3C71_690640 [compost metagenome]